MNLWLKPYLLALLIGSLFLLKACAPGPGGSSVFSSWGSGGDSYSSGGDGSGAGPSLEALRRGEVPTDSPRYPLKDVYYDYDRHEIRPDGREVLEANARWLRANAWARVEIEGHADERGTNEYNLALGARRAQTSMDYLLSLGVSGDRVSAVSYGEEIPVCREHRESCWQKNRRARFVIVTTGPSS